MTRNPPNTVKSGKVRKDIEIFERDGGTKGWDDGWMMPVEVLVRRPDVGFPGFFHRTHAYKLQMDA